MNRRLSFNKYWFLVIFLTAMLFLTSQLFAKQSLAQTPTAEIVTGALNVRSGPGLEYSVVTVVNQGNVVNLLGRNADSTWAYVQTATAVLGWVNASSTYINPSVAISSLDVVTPNTPTPTGTLTPTQYANLNPCPSYSHADGRTANWVYRHSQQWGAQRS